ncbi:MAG TPA: hypothetical protein VFO10_00745 [Oligoflexus sp.]|uniref:hypothetical protein n=1 Tax=Oligoflexus sp. TaxID=1971216 RepID=UPI002D7E51E1|nr:hypothetical protein [Oligoflexus sp.]HET9235742.1 hypothetical protein [Oligoflexus sp.]
MRPAFFILSLLLAFARTAEAGLTLMGGAGASVGNLTKSSGPLLSKGYHYSLMLSYVPESGRRPWPLVFGVQVKQHKVNFTEDGVKKRATYNLYGGHLGLSLMLTPSFTLQVSGEYYGTAKISVLSSHQVRLNGNAYKYSSFEQYEGGAASGLRFQISHDKADGQFSARNRYRSGLGVSLVQQSFGTESTKITTSDSELTPSQTLTQSEVSYRLILMSVDLYIGLTF